MIYSRKHARFYVNQKSEQKMQTMTIIEYNRASVSRDSGTVGEPRMSSDFLPAYYGRSFTSSQRPKGHSDAYTQL